MDIRLSVVVLMCAYVMVCGAVPQSMPEPGATTEATPVRVCHPLAISQCLGYGYDMTSLTKDEQREEASKISALLEAGRNNTSPIQIPFFCLALVPKCKSNKHHDIRTCKGSCTRYMRTASSREIGFIDEVWYGDKLNCDKFESRRGDFDSCVPYKRILKHALAKAERKLK